MTNRFSIISVTGFLILIVLSLGCVSEKQNEEITTEGPLNLQESQKITRWSKDVPLSEVDLFKYDFTDFLRQNEDPLKVNNFIKDKNGKIVSLNPYSFPGIDIDQENNIYMIRFGWSGAHLQKFDQNGNKVNEVYLYQDLTPYDPSISIFENTIYLVFRRSNHLEDTSSRSLHFSKLSLDGNPLMNVTEIIGRNVNPYGYRFSLDSEGNICLVYSSAPPNRIAYFSKMDAFGGEIIQPIKLTEQLVGFPDIVIDSKDNVHIVWIEGPLARGPGAVYYTVLKNGEKNVSSKKVLGQWATITEFDIYRPSESPLIKIDSKDNVHIVWSTENGSVEYLKLNPLGELLERETIISEKARIPTLAIDSNDRVHVSWIDGRYVRDPQNYSFPGLPEFFKFFYNRYYKTTRDISEIEERLRPVNPPIDNFEVIIPKDPLEFRILELGWKDESDYPTSAEEIRKWGIEKVIGFWGTGIKGAIVFIKNDSGYFIGMEKSGLVEGKDTHFIKHFYNFYNRSSGRFLYAGKLKHSFTEFDEWDTRIDITDKGEAYLLNVTFRQPIQDKDKIREKLDTFDNKKVKSFTEHMNHDYYSRRKYSDGELMSYEVITDNGMTEIKKEVWSEHAEEPKKLSTNYTNVDLDLVNKKIVTQLKDSLFGEGEFDEYTFHHALEVPYSEYDWLIVDTKIIYDDGSEMELKCVDSAEPNSPLEWITCSLRLDAEYYYLVNQYASFIYRAVE